MENSAKDVEMTGSSEHEDTESLIEKQSAQMVHFSLLLFSISPI